MTAGLNSRPKEWSRPPEPHPPDAGYWCSSRKRRPYVSLIWCSAPSGHGNGLKPWIRNNDRRAAHEPVNLPLDCKHAHVSRHSWHWWGHGSALTVNSPLGNRSECGRTNHEVTHDRNSVIPDRQQKLENHIRAVEKADLHCGKVVFPHAAKSLVGDRCDALAISGKTLPPVTQRVVVV